MTSFPETTRQLRRLRFNLRALLCEYLITLALRVAPEGYLPAGKLRPRRHRQHHRGNADENSHYVA